jgi:hypothetical protein
MIDLLTLIEGKDNVRPLSMSDTILKAKLKSDKIFITVIGGGNVAIIRNNPVPVPFAYVDVQADIAVTIVHMEHFSRIVPLVYQQVFFLYNL